MHSCIRSLRIVFNSTSHVPPKRDRTGCGHQRTAKAEPMRARESGDQRVPRLPPWEHECWVQAQSAIRCRGAVAPFRHNCDTVSKKGVTKSPARDTTRCRDSHPFIVRKLVRQKARCPPLGTIRGEVAHRTIVRPVFFLPTNRLQHVLDRVAIQSVNRQRRHRRIRPLQVWQYRPPSRMRIISCREHSSARGYITFSAL